MTNLESIIKNIVGIFVGVYVWFNYKENSKMRFYAWIMPSLLGFVTFATIWMTIKDYTPAQPTVIPSILKEKVKPIIDTPIEVKSDSLEVKNISIQVENAIKNTDKKEEIVKTIEKEEKIEKGEKVIEIITTKPSPLEKTKALIYQYKTFSDGSILNLEKGEKLVCMFSMTCGHCQEIYKNFCEVSQYASFPKPYLLNYGREFEQNFFFNQAGGCKDAHIRIEDYTAFMRLLEGKSFPQILAFKDGKIVNSWDIDTYSKKSFLYFYAIEEQEVKTTNGLGLEEEGDTELGF